MTTAQDLQLQYYQKTADNYENNHVGEGRHNFNSLKTIVSLCSELEIESVLDTGCGTFWSFPHFQEYFPQARIVGADISPDLLKIGQEKYQINQSDLVCCSSYELPFEDNAFDIVTEFSMLHHVAEPERVIAEMLRVAKKGIFLSDSNRFGQGALPAKLAKLALYRTGLWWPLRWAVTGGKRWSYSEGDGLYYSYSVYDNLALVSASCQRVLSIPGAKNPKAAFSPGLFSPQILLCGFK